MGHPLQPRRCSAWACLLLGAGVLAAAGRASAQAPPPPEVNPTTAIVRNPAFTGTGSCAAAACHNGRREPLGLKGSEYQFFATYDPHRKAWSVLFDDRSKRIEKNLKKLDALDKAKPESNDLCLSCHVAPNYKEEATQTRIEGFTQADGVVCESCHGPAENWLTAHTELGFQTLSAQQKEDGYGLWNTKSLARRAKVCTDCHVGNGTMDVNHDLIAAGHPRLAFEFNNQLAKYPKHWDIRDDKARDPDYEIKTWVLGQVATARSGLALLETRANAAAAGHSQWPEFTEYECFSCHHELDEPARRRVYPIQGVKPGSLAWGTWLAPDTDLLAQAENRSETFEVAQTIAELRLLMARPSPDAKAVASYARKGTEQLDRWAAEIDSKPVNADQVKAILGTLLKQKDENWTWDHRARRYLALSAASRGFTELTGSAPESTVSQTLSTLYDQLRFPPGFDSPDRPVANRVSEASRSLRPPQR